MPPGDLPPTWKHWQAAEASSFVGPKLSLPGWVTPPLYPMSSLHLLYPLLAPSQTADLHPLCP